MILNFRFSIFCQFFENILVFSEKNLKSSDFRPDISGISRYISRNKNTAHHQAGAQVKFSLPGQSERHPGDVYVHSMSDTPRAQVA